ncbi:MAG: DUF1801 domain-containing protein [Bacteroidota bacterium]
MIQEVNEYIEKSAAHQQAVLRQLRTLILAAAPNIQEQYKWSRPVYALEDDFCYLKTTKKHVTLGFFEFDKIKTNADRIEGTGKSMRHVKLSQVEDIEALQIKAMLQEVLA